MKRKKEQEKRTVIMIPARAGSKRCKNKNIRYLGNKPLIQYAIDLSLKCLDKKDIYVNTEDDLIAEIAAKSGVQIHRRPSYLSSDTATNDEFVAQFLEHVDCDNVCQILATSPFLKEQEVKDVIGYINNGFKTVVSVNKKKISYTDQEGNEYNYNTWRPLAPSQDMKAVWLFASGIMAWNKKDFLSHFCDRNGSAYYGGDQVRFYPLTGFSLIDIDTEDDFLMAEAALPSVEELRNENWPAKKAFYYEKSTHFEYDVPSILRKDGVKNGNFSNSNADVVSVTNLCKKASSGATNLINTEHNSVTLITQEAGEGNREHYHPDWDEWWYIVEGKWLFQIEGEDKQVTEGDLVFIPKGKKHKITALTKASRLAVSRSNVAHVYQEK